MTHCTSIVCPIPRPNPWDIFFCTLLNKCPWKLWKDKIFLMNLLFIQVKTQRRGKLKLPVKRKEFWTQSLYYMTMTNLSLVYELILDFRGKIFSVGSWPEAAQKLELTWLTDYDTDWLDCSHVVCCQRSRQTGFSLQKDLAGLTHITLTFITLDCIFVQNAFLHITQPVGSIAPPKTTFDVKYIEILKVHGLFCFG